MSDTSHADNTSPADMCPDCGGDGCVPVGGAFSRGWTNRCESCGGTGKREFHAPDTKPPTWGRTDCLDCGGTGDRPKEDDMSDPRIKIVNDALQMVGREPLPESTVRLVLNSIEGTGDLPATVKPDDPEGDGFRVDRPAITAESVRQKSRDAARRKFCGICGVKAKAFITMGPDRHIVCLDCCDDVISARGTARKYAPQDRPAVTERRIRRIRETVEGEGAFRHFTAEARLLHIAGLLGTEYAPAEKLPGWEPPAVTDAEVEAATSGLGHGLTIEQVREILEAAAATRQEQENT